MATPFVQGQLRGEKLAVEIDTACAHCDQELHITLDSEMQWSVKQQDASVLVFEPEVDWGHFTEANIVHRY